MVARHHRENRTAVKREYASFPGNKVNTAAAGWFLTLCGSCRIRRGGPHPPAPPPALTRPPHPACIPNRKTRRCCSAGGNLTKDPSRGWPPPEAFADESATPAGEGRGITGVAPQRIAAARSVLCRARLRPRRNESEVPPGRKAQHERPRLEVLHEGHEIAPREAVRVEVPGCGVAGEKRPDAPRAEGEEEAVQDHGVGDVGHLRAQRADRGSGETIEQQASISLIFSRTCISSKHRRRHSRASDSATLSRGSVSGSCAHADRPQLLYRSVNCASVRPTRLQQRLLQGPSLSLSVCLRMCACKVVYATRSRRTRVRVAPSHLCESMHRQPLCRPPHDARHPLLEGVQARVHSEHELVEVQALLGARGSAKEEVHKEGLPAADRAEEVGAQGLGLQRRLRRLGLLLRLQQRLRIRRGEEWGGEWGK